MLLDVLSAVNDELHLNYTITGRLDISFELIAIAQP